MNGQMTEKINTFDNHDKAYYLWKTAGIKEAAVVHVDAHPDLFEPQGTSAPVISDYLRWALREGILREVHWVIPKHTWDANTSRRVIQCHLKAIANTSGGADNWFKPEKRQGGLSLYGRPVTVCSLESLPDVKPPLLLDIDVDYLLLKDIPLSGLHRMAERPWIWPSELAPLLSDLAVAAEMVTISYSISGCFVPLQWKHLGDDLALIFASNQPDKALEYVSLKRQMAEALLDGDIELHNKLREAAEKLNPKDASLHHWRALALIAEGNIDAAREAQARAVELDLTYKCSCGFGGLIYEAHGEYDKAEKAYRLAAELSNSDPMGWYGLGRTAMRKNDKQSARKFLTLAASFPNAPAEVHRELAALAESEGDLEEALRQYRWYLRTAHAGRSLEHPIASVPLHGFRSPFWSEGYSAMARIYSAKGNTRLFSNCYSEALKLANPRLYKAARPILRKMGGAKDVTAGTVLWSLAKSAAVGLGLGIQHIRRRIKLRLSPAGSEAAASRMCPPVRLPKR